MSSLIVSLYATAVAHSLPMDPLFVRLGNSGHGKESAFSVPFPGIMIVPNSESHHLQAFFVATKRRTARGEYFEKPTGARSPRTVPATDGQLRHRGAGHTVRAGFFLSPLVVMAFRVGLSS